MESPLDSRQKSQISPSQEGFGVFIVSVLEKIEPVLIRNVLVTHHGIDICVNICWANGKLQQW